MLCFLQFCPFCHPKTCRPNLIVCFCNALAFQILDRFIDSICFNLQNLFVHFLKRNTIACSSFQHYFLQLFNNLQIAIIILITIITIIVIITIISVSTRAYTSIKNIAINVRPAKYIQIYKIKS